MAAAQHKLSRRALLGAAFAVPCAASLVEGPVPSSSFPRKRESSFSPSEPHGDARWKRALARFRRAETALKAAEGQPDDLYGDRLCAFNAALRRLARMPAPDLPALAAKIALIVDHEVATLTGGEACMAAVKRDALRLAAPAA